ncbi:MAG TPA: SCO family protein [Burkholderiales bacterium]|nr:SCO family protein [Burkholderiales bacterium]
MSSLLRSFVLCVLLVLAACSNADKPAFQATDITGADFGRDFSLTDQNGKRRALQDFRGQVVVMFFGYTHCPDVCPTTLAELAGAVRKLGKSAEKVQVLLVTVDPDRDTPEIMGKYVSAFNPTFLALRGDADETSRVAKEFKVIYQKVAGPRPETYTMDHSAGSYVFDPQGRLRLYVSYGRGADVFAHDIDLLLKSP